MRTHCYKTKQRSLGQAMTETIITVSTVLAPVFLLIPLLGKYVDMKHTTIQAARYEAWEYTVWYGNNRFETLTDPGGERPFGYSASGQPVKTPVLLRQESRKRFFSDYNDTDNVANLQLTDTDKGVANVTTPNTLWVDHRGQPMWDGTTTSNNATSSGPTPDLTGGVFNTILNIFDAVFGVVASIVSHLTNSGVGFTIINMDGRATSSVQISVFPPTGLINFKTFVEAAQGGTDDSVNIPQLDFSATASVLSDTWNAGGLEHTTNQVGGLVPTKILADLFKPVQPVVDTLTTFLAPELRGCNPWIQLPDVLDPSINPDGSSDGSLWLGYINIDAVHPDRLEDGGSHDCPDGICVLDPKPSRSTCDT